MNAPARPALLATAIPLLIWACLAPARPTPPPLVVPVVEGPEALASSSVVPSLSVAPSSMGDPSDDATSTDPVLVHAPTAGGLIVSAMDGTSARPLAGRGRYLEPRWSPDGRLIAARVVDPAGERLVVIDMAGTRVLDELSRSGRLEFAWALDAEGRHRLAATIDEGLRVFDLDDGTSVEVLAAPSSWISALAWSTTAPMLYWSSSDGPRGNAIITVTGARLEPGRAASPRPTGSVVELEAGGGRSYRAFEVADVSPDGRAVAFRARIESWAASQAVVVPLDGGTPSRRDEVLSAWTDGFAGITWSLDGRSVVGDVLLDDRLVPTVMPVDGSPPTRLTQERDHDWLVVDRGGRSSSGTYLVGRLTADQPDDPLANLTAVDLWAVRDDGTRLTLIVEDVIGADLR